MANRIRGNQKALVNLEPTYNKPLDARATVQTYEDLKNPETWAVADSPNGNNLYPGMVVSVTNDRSTELNGIYFLKNHLNFQDDSAWAKSSAGNDGGGGGGSSFFSTISDIDENGEMIDFSSTDPQMMEKASTAFQNAIDQGFGSGTTALMNKKDLYLTKQIFVRGTLELSSNTTIHLMNDDAGLVMMRIFPIVRKDTNGIIINYMPYENKYYAGFWYDIDGKLKYIEKEDNAERTAFIPSNMVAIKDRDSMIKTTTEIKEMPELKIKFLQKPVDKKINTTEDPTKNTTISSRYWAAIDGNNLIAFETNNLRYVNVNEKISMLPFESARIEYTSNIIEGSGRIQVENDRWEGAAITMESARNCRVKDVILLGKDHFFPSGYGIRIIAATNDASYNNISTVTIENFEKAISVEAYETCGNDSTQNGKFEYAADSASEAAIEDQFWNNVTDINASTSFNEKSLYFKKHHTSQAYLSGQSGKLSVIVGDNIEPLTYLQQNVYDISKEPRSVGQVGDAMCYYGRVVQPNSDASFIPPINGVVYSYIDQDQNRVYETFNGPMFQYQSKTLDNNTNIYLLPCSDNNIPDTVEITTTESNEIVLNDTAVGVIKNVPSTGNITYKYKDNKVYYPKDYGHHRWREYTPPVRRKEITGDNKVVHYYEYTWGGETHYYNKVYGDIASNIINSKIMGIMEHGSNSGYTEIFNKKYMFIDLTHSGEVQYITFIDIHTGATELISTRLRPGWVSDKTYNEGDYVSYYGRIYRAVKKTDPYFNPSSDGSDNEYWKYTGVYNQSFSFGGDNWQWDKASDGNNDVIYIYLAGSDTPYYLTLRYTIQTPEQMKKMVLKGDSAQVWIEEGLKNTIDAQIDDIGNWGQNEYVVSIRPDSSAALCYNVNASFVQTGGNPNNNFFLNHRSNENPIPYIFNELSDLPYYGIVEYYDKTTKEQRYRIGLSNGEGNYYTWRRVVNNETEEPYRWVNPSQLGETGVTQDNVKTEEETGLVKVPYIQELKQSLTEHFATDLFNSSGRDSGTSYLQYATDPNILTFHGGSTFVYPSNIDARFHTFANPKENINNGVELLIHKPDQTRIIRLDYWSTNYMSHRIYISVYTKASSASDLAWTDFKEVSLTNNLIYLEKYLSFTQLTEIKAIKIRFMGASSHNRGFMPYARINHISTIAGGYIEYTSEQEEAATLANLD